MENSQNCKIILDYTYNKITGIFTDENKLNDQYNKLMRSHYSNMKKYLEIKISEINIYNGGNSIELLINLKEIKKYYQKIIFGLEKRLIDSTDISFHEVGKENDIYSSIGEVLYYSELIKKLSTTFNPDITGLRLSRFQIVELPLNDTSNPYNLYII